MIKSYLTRLILVLLVMGSLSAQQLSRKEKKIMASVHNNTAEAIAFPERVENINMRSWIS